MYLMGQTDGRIAALLYAAYTVQGPDMGLISRPLWLSHSNL